MLVLVVAEPSASKLLQAQSDPDRPERFQCAECGRIEQGLARSCEMKTPPFSSRSGACLLGLADWLPGARRGIMALTLEASRLIRARLEFSDEVSASHLDLVFGRTVAAVFYAFTSNEGPSEFRGFFHSPNYLTQRTAGMAMVRTTWSMLRWLPMTFFCFVFAQTYN